MVIPPRAPSPHSGAVFSQGQTGLHPFCFFQKPLLLLRTQSPTHLHRHHHYTQTHTHTLQPENHRLGFDGLRSPAKSSGVFFLGRACDGKQRGDGDVGGGRSAW